MEALKRLYDRFIRTHTGARVTCVASYNELNGHDLALLRRADVMVRVLDLAPKAGLDDLALTAPRVKVPTVSAGFLWPFAGKSHPRNEPSWLCPLGRYTGELGDSYLNRLIAQGLDPEEAVTRSSRLSTSPRSETSTG